MKVAVVGLGTEGLEVAVRLASAGMNVRGIDSDPDKIEILATGSSYVNSIPSLTVRELTRRGALSVTCDDSAVCGAEFIILCIPVPTDSNGQPRTGFFLNRCKSLAQHMSPDAVVVLGPLPYPRGLESKTVEALNQRAGFPAWRNSITDTSVDFQKPKVKSNTADIPAQRSSRAA